MKKRFDAVRFQRNVRKELSKKYTRDPQALVTDLERIRKKYHLARRKRTTTIKRQKAASLRGA